MYFEITEDELAHLLFACEGFLITGENVCVSVPDGFADEGGGRGVVVAVHEGDDIAAVPVGDLRVEHAADCIFVLRANMCEAAGKNKKSDCDGNLAKCSAHLTVPCS